MVSIDYYCHLKMQKLVPVHGILLLFFFSYDSFRLHSWSGHHPHTTWWQYRYTRMNALLKWSEIHCIYLCEITHDLAVVVWSNNVQVYVTCGSQLTARCAQFAERCGCTLALLPESSGIRVDGLGPIDYEVSGAVIVHRGGSTVLTALRDIPYSPSFVLDLASDVDPRMRNLIDFVFLPGFNNPTVAVLVQPQQTWTGYVFTSTTWQIVYQLFFPTGAWKSTKTLYNFSFSHLILSRENTQ